MSKKDKDGLDPKGQNRRNLLKAGTAAGVSLALGSPASAERGNDRRGDEHHGGKSWRYRTHTSVPDPYLLDYLTLRLSY